MELLSSAFVSKHNTSQNLSLQLTESLRNIQSMNDALSKRNDSMEQLKVENKDLKDQIRKLNVSLDNVNGDNQNLQSKLGIIQHDMDGLKSNTSRLLGENAGLEKVLNVKAEFEDNKVEAAEKVLDLASKKGIKKIKIITEDEEDDNFSNETVEEATKEIEEVVERNIRKMAKQNNEKLKPILDVLSKVAESSTRSTLSQNDNIFETLFSTKRAGADTNFESEHATSTKLPESNPKGSLMEIKPTEDINIMLQNGTVDKKSKSNKNELDIQLSSNYTDEKNNLLRPLTPRSNVNASSIVPTPSATPKLENGRRTNDNNENKLAEINMAMKNTKKAIKKLKQFGKILKEVDVEKESKEETGGGGIEFEDTENNDHGAINAKEASHQIAKIVKELPNLVKI